MPHKESAVRWGVIGLGGVVVQQIAPAIQKSANSKLVACAGSTPEKTRAFAEKYGVPRRCAGIEELAAADEVDAIFIATPNADHHRMVLAAARAGKHVLCEKPLAMSIEHGREMVDACRAARVILRTAFQIRLEEILVRVREIVRSGALGELRAILFERIAPLRQHGAWRDDPRQGGVVFDVAVHLFDQVEWLTGLQVRELSAYSHPDRRLGVADSTIAILGMLGDGCHMVVRASREIPYAGNDLRIQCSQGMLTTSCCAGRMNTYCACGKPPTAKPSRDLAPTAIYERQIAAFADEVQAAQGASSRQAKTAYAQSSSRARRSLPSRRGGRWPYSGVTTLLYTIAPRQSRG